MVGSLSLDGPGLDLRACADGPSLGRGPVTIGTLRPPVGPLAPDAHISPGRTNPEHRAALRPATMSRSMPALAHGLETGRRRLFIVLFVNFIGFGAGAVLIGAIMPMILRDYAWTYVLMGVLMSCGAVGYFVSTFVCGLLVRHLGSRVVIVSTQLIRAAGFMLFGRTPEMGVNLLAVALIGLGEGGIEVVTNLCVVRMESAGRSRLMNLMHAGFPLGAILASLVTSFLLNLGVAWQSLFRGLAWYCVVGSWALYRQQFPAMRPESSGNSSLSALNVVLRRPLLVLLSLVILMYVGVEIGVSNWVAEYYVQVLDTSPARGAAMVSVVWFGLLAGRLVLSFGYRSTRQAPLLAILAAVSTFFLALALHIDVEPVVTILFGVTGIGLSAVYPVTIVLVGQYFPTEQGLAIGVVSTAGGVGCFLFPLVMSSVAQSYGMIAGFWFYVALCATTTLVALLVLWYDSSRR